MGETTAIAWTDHTFNPWWGCARVSPGCEHCYAETFAKRTGHKVWGKTSDRRRFDQNSKHWDEPIKWNRAAEAEGRRHRVFCASMADVFEARDDHEDDRQLLWEIIGETPWLDWQLLTKRPQNVLEMVPDWWLTEGIEEWERGEWPANVWIGTTVEDQQRADERIPLLLAIPARVRFLSCEPLLGPITFRWASWVDYSQRKTHNELDGLRGIHWVICGGESGNDHRPMNLDHARTLRSECHTARVPFFFKQVGGRTPMAGGDSLDGFTEKAFPEVARAR